LLHSEVKNEAFVDHKGVDRQALEVEIDRTKTHRAGDPKKIIVSDYDHQWSAFKCVNRLKRIAGAGMKSDQFLFPQVTFKRGVPDDLDWSKSLSYAALVKCIKHDVAKCGMDPTDFSGHSFRAGGATDLFASGKLTFAQIMKLGRWRSIEACMMYYREDLEVSGRAGEVFGTQAAESFARTTR
jgi:integrase